MIILTQFIAHIFSLSVTLAITVIFILFFFNDPATTEIYTLSLHDALPILNKNSRHRTCTSRQTSARQILLSSSTLTDRKSTRLNSSHVSISYAVFCLKKKKKTTNKNQNNQ